MQALKTWNFASLLEPEPGRLAFRCRSYVATRAELRHASRRAAAHLVCLGFERGDVLALWLPDGGAWLQLFFAAAQLGVLVVPISTRYRLNEARHVVETSRAKAIAVATDFLGFDYAASARAIQAGLPHVQHVVVIPKPEGFLDVETTMPMAASIGWPSDPLCTFSTSGTTGHPKLAVHDQASIARHAENVARLTELKPGDVMLCALSLYGVLGFVQMIGALAGHACCVFLQVFDAAVAAKAIEANKVTHFFGSDGIFSPVLDAPDCALASWRWGGFAEFAGLAAKIVERAEREWGLHLFGLYGSSECFALTATALPGDASSQRMLAGGLPISPSIEFRVVNVETEQSLPDGERGELQIRGYNVMESYLNNPAATQAAMTSDGWFRTGDLAYKTGDRFVFLSRLRDGLRLRGYLVDPTEIEDFLAQHAAVAEAQVVGVNRVGEGDVAVAFVRTRSAAVRETELLDYCKVGIANYKVPRRIIFVDDYPRVDGPNGTKILKNKLREMAEAAVASN
jgi:acyl-CoA synthetase (AMP-forming)/AMP-acid ligase II